MKSLIIALSLALISICRAQIVPNSNTTLEIAVIDFLYSAPPKNNELETNLLIPIIDRELTSSGLSNYKLRARKVSKGRLHLFQARRAVSHLDTSGISFDIGIWGHVKPLSNWPGDYNLQMIIFTNSKKWDECLFYYEFEVRDTRIKSWNYKSFDAPESSIAVLPSIMCSKMLRSEMPFSDRLEARLLSMVGELPANGILNWHPDQKCDGTHDFSVGYLDLQFEDSEILNLPLPAPMYHSIVDNLSKHVVYNWDVTGPAQYATQGKNWHIGLDVGAQRLDGDRETIGIGAAIQGVLSYDELIPSFDISVGVGYSEFKYNVDLAEKTVGNTTDLFNLDLWANYKVLSNSFFKPYLTLGFGVLNFHVRNSNTGRFWDAEIFAGGGFLLPLDSQFGWAVHFSADYSYTSGDSFDNLGLSNEGGKDGYFNLRIGFRYRLNASAIVVR